MQSTQDISNQIMDEHRNNKLRDNFFPKMIDAMGYQHACEIGTDKGEFADHLLGKSNLQTLACIDPWLDNFGSDYHPGRYHPHGATRKAQAQERLQKYGQRVVLMPHYSVDAARSVNLVMANIDFVYIDGDHSLFGVYTDIMTWTPLIRIGGMVAGHDYKDGGDSGMLDYHGKQLPYRVKTVVDDFCSKYGFTLHVVGGVIKSWWFEKTHEFGT